MASDDFDPRFDPAFQPGYVPSPDAAPARPPRSDPPAQAALDRRTERATAVTVTEESDEQKVPERGRVNPFLLALAAIALLLIVGGVSAIQQVRGIFDAEDISVDLDYVSLNMLIFAAPLAIALGVATGIGVLFMFAVDWRRRHRA